MTLRYALALLALTAVSASASSVHAQDGRLDPAFNTDGVAFAPLAGAFAHDVAVDDQKGTVVVGSYRFSSTTSGAFVARYRPDGTLDPLFDADGIVTLTFGGTINGFAAVAVDAAGRYVVAGTAGSSLIVARFLDDGRLDTSFGTAGIRRFFAGGGPTAVEMSSSVAVDGVGAIYVGGTSNVNSPTARGFVARFTPTGDLDSSYGSDGVVRLALDGTSINDIALTGDGQLAFTGAAISTVDGTTDILVGRLIASGALDTSFSFDGLLTVDVKKGNDEGAAVLVYTDGSLSVVGSGEADEQQLIAALSLNSAGVRTAGYGNDGLVLIDASPEDDEGTDTGSDAALDSDGRLVIVGSTRFKDGTQGKMAGVVVRLLPSGARDTAFGINGLVRTDADTLADGFVDSYAAVALDKRLGIFAAGHGLSGGEGRAVVARYTSTRMTATDGTPAGAVRLALSAATPNPTSGQTVLRYTLAEATDATLALHDVLGREVARLADGPLTAGEHTARFDAGSLAPGVYVVRLQTGSAVQTGRLTVVR